MQNQDRYKTILVIVTGLLVLSWIFKVEALHWIAMGIGVVSIFVKLAARGIEWIWLKLAHVLGWINSKILLGLIYFVFLLPIAWLSRLFTKDPLQLSGEKSKSLFHERNHMYTKEDLENIW